MTDEILETLLDGNQAHVDGLAKDHFEGIVDGQSPPVVSMCCSDSRVPQQGMFHVDEPGWLFTPSTIGNQVTDVVEGDQVIDGSLLYPVQHTGTRTIAVVGHTGCGAVTAALDAVDGDPPELAPGVAKRVALLAPIVRQTLDDGRVDAHAPRERVIDQLVEANVHAQVDTLLDSPEIPDDATVYGFVYDLTGAYGGPRGRTYLVNADGEQDPDALRALVPADRSEHVASLLT